ncbi:hypothetical protein GOP47_0011169 [Adiantum capillus-veneris]|uniref:Uncharacterized protein n=1 Tax=Adiantum capillus-veneris TaxID=13818 RepID=A0A9D4USS4_ADICA|nr:hypothetical protein GOP47_0011169 [Adiantum capillus-veneris]
MSDLARKVHNAVKPSKPLISSTPHKFQGIVKKGKDLASPAKSITKLPTSVGKVSSSKVTGKTFKFESDKKEKKVYELPGQKHDPPEERDPLRIFYESLYNQNPKSEMAQIWMMEHGLLPSEAAKKALERKKKSQLNQKLGLPAKASKAVTFKSERVVTKGMVITPERKVFSSNGGSKLLSNVKRKLDMASDSDDDDKPLKPKKKPNTCT